MKTIALFVNDPKCSVQSSNGIIKALDGHYHFKLFSKNEVEDGFFNNVNAVVVPGGFGDADSYNSLFKYNGRAVKKYIKSGGRYLGICMGAYWASSLYLNILDNVEAVQYLKRPDTDTRRPHAKNIRITWRGEPMNMFWYDGCALIGDGKKEVVATYSNGDAMAIIQNRIGLIGCHPESEQFWYDSYSWMNGKYHNGTHHKLLLEFVNELMEK
jgi:hypothetical protein